MSRKRSHPATELSCEVSAASFSWPLPVLAGLEHGTLPWFDSAEPRWRIDRAEPLAREWGSRHALSLLAQFAAHQSFLEFAGILDNPFDPAEWRVERRRGADVRLLRVAARSGSESGRTGFDQVRECARLLGVKGLESLVQVWGRADHVYEEARRRLRRGGAADLRWCLGAAVGAVAGAEPETTEQLLRHGGVIVTRPSGLMAIERAARIDGRVTLEVGGDGSSPLQQKSALRAIESIEKGVSRLDPEAMSERLGECVPRAHVVVAEPRRLDPASREVVRLLVRHSEAMIVAIGSDGAETLLEGDFRAEEPRWFVIAPSMEARGRVDSFLRGLPPEDPFEALRRFAESTECDRFLRDLELPESTTEDPGDLDRIEEPARSYLSALALLGKTIDIDFARRFLDGIEAVPDLDQLLACGVLALEGKALSFRSDATRLALAANVPEETLARLCRVALDLAGEEAPLAFRVELMERAGDEAQLLELLTAAIAESGAANELIRSRAARLPRDSIRKSPRLAEGLANDFFSRGRYRDVRELVRDDAFASAPLMRARVERRLGNYTAALAELDSIEPATFESALLRGELCRLEGDHAGAAEALAAALAWAADPKEHAAARFESAMLAIDRGERPDDGWITEATPVAQWLVHRFETYSAVHRGDLEAAVREASLAIEMAPDLPQRIDAQLDLVYSHFIAGDWSEARRAAREAFGTIEETHGDRAGGGILFFLAFLNADEGKRSEAVEKLAQLEEFYAGTGDERRRRELDLIRAQIALVELDAPSARRSASSASACSSPDIRFAAHVILDELDWIEGTLHLPRTSGDSPCVELVRRHGLNAARCGLEVSFEGSEICREIAELERRALSGSKIDRLPQFPRRADRLRLLRSIVGLSRRSADPFLSTAAKALASELGIALPVRREKEPAELRLLAELASVDFPPPDEPIAGLDWRYAVRNRLGNWMQSGTMGALDTAELRSAEAERGAMKVGDNGLLWFEGSEHWAPEIFRAVAHLWAVRWEHRNLLRLMSEPAPEIRDGVDESDGMIAESMVMREALAPLASIRERDLPVCIEGESGTGKELVARAIHRRSRRKNRSFTAVNCAALPDSLIESELFGHVRGAFTGADRDRIGLIEASDGGTLFLDEIGEMPLPAQAKLLRFLQEGEFRRVGETTTRSADVRIIAATNRTLAREVDEGRFRQDLYYRVTGLEIALPPLRRRGRDVLLLARKFLQHEREQLSCGPSSFSEEVESVLQSYEWPGNIRELQNVVRGAHALAGEARAVELGHLPARLLRPATPALGGGAFYSELAQFRRSLLERSLEDSGGNRSRAAKSLGMTRQALSYQIRELGIHVEKRKKS
jgi:DNA-binding NtrC family response regulator/tetratricopeptide (TPR) repeat protein